MNDTQAKVERLYNKMLLSKTPQERLKMASRMFDSGRKLVISGILRGVQNLDSSQLRTQLFLRIYKNDFTPAKIKRIINRISDIQLDKGIKCEV